MNWRAERMAEADKGASAVFTLIRPRGHFGLPRDSISLAAQSPPQRVPQRTPGVCIAKLERTDGAGRAWPAANNEVVLLELPS